MNADEPSLRKLARIPSIALLTERTPITRMDGPLRVPRIDGINLGKIPASPIGIKRDDLTPGFGNKTRKLELLLADALAQGADCVITAGGPQSNHCRQTAQFAREHGLETHLVFGTRGGERDFPHVGNQVINRLFGARSHVCRSSDRDQAMDDLAQALREKGRTPYIIPVGGSNHLGVLAYARGFLEFLEQADRREPPVDRIVVATSSGGTQAGLVLGAKLAGWQGEILGISIDQIPDVEEPNESLRYVNHMVTITNQALEHLGSNASVAAKDFKLNHDYLQDGYGVVGDYDRLGVRTLANHGILSGPVYSGRAFGALIDLLAKGMIPDDGSTLFWHTGGAGELEFYKDDLFQST